MSFFVDTNALHDKLRTAEQRALDAERRYAEIEEMAKDWRHSNEFIGQLFRRTALAQHDQGGT